ncbi:MAG: disulfide bond formation protein B [Haloarculaceae archaeon]
MFGDDDLTVRALLVAATLVVLVATAGSLFLSEVWRLVPCELCWYQRILVYPLVVVLGVAALDRRARVYRTVLPLTLAGTAVAAYHTWVQAAAGGGGAGCSIGSCGAVLFRLQPLGLTIPTLSLLAFLFVTAAMLVLWRRG